MAVDPNDGRVLFLGTRKSGLWKSADGAATWSQGDELPRRRAAALGRRSQAARLERRRPQHHRLRRLRSATAAARQRQPRRCTPACRCMGRARPVAQQRRRATPGSSVAGQPTEVPPQSRGAGRRRKPVHHATAPIPGPCRWRTARCGSWTRAAAPGPTSRPDKPDQERKFGYGGRVRRRERPAGA